MRQIVCSKGNIVEKVIRDKAGNLVRAKFYVYECAGRVKVRLIDATLIEEIKQICGTILSLPTYVKSKLNWSEFFGSRNTSFASVVSNILYFSGSKPRAPTL